MIGVIVFYRAYELPEKVVSIANKFETPALSSHFISPRLVGGSEGNSTLILDFRYPDDFRGSREVNPRPVSSNFRPPERQTAENNSSSVFGLTTSPASDKKIGLKSVCCEKYKKGNRCKRCPCFDLQ